MDLAYDHIQEEVLSTDETAPKDKGKQNQVNLNTEFKEAYKSFSASPWGARLGGFFSDVKKQGETYYEGARQEASVVSGEALKGLTDLKSTIVNRTRSLSTGQSPPAASGSKDPAEVSTSNTTNKGRTESEALRESEGIVSRFRTEAAKRLKEIEKAEDAADEALLKFGKNIRNFLRDAVSIAPPSEETNQDGTQKVLFESKDQDGKRVIHTTRFEAQLHAIHSSPDSFAKDPVSPEYEKWKETFDVEKKTDAISSDLKTYQELRRSMEKLVPEKVEYAQFWARYYFLLMVIETEEQRRRDMLKGAALSSPDEDIAWDNDSDTESQPSTPHAPAPPSSSSNNNNNPKSLTQQTHSSTTTIQAPLPEETETETPTTTSTLALPRRSQDQASQPDSDASYDLVSGATSQGPGSPKEEKEKDAAANDSNARGTKDDGEEEEPDWE